MFCKEMFKEIANKKKSGNKETCEVINTFIICYARDGNFERNVFYLSSIGCCRSILA